MSLKEDLINDYRELGTDELKSVIHEISPPVRRRRSVSRRILYTGLAVGATLGLAEYAGNKFGCPGLANALSGMWTVSVGAGVAGGFISNTFYEGTGWRRTESMLYSAAKEALRRNLLKRDLDRMSHMRASGGGLKR